MSATFPCGHLSIAAQVARWPLRTFTPWEAVWYCGGCGNNLMYTNNRQREIQRLRATRSLTSRAAEYAMGGVQ